MAAILNFGNLAHLHIYLCHKVCYGCVGWSVCLSVCRQDYSQSDEQMNFSIHYILGMIQIPAGSFGEDLSSVENVIVKIE